MSRFFNSEYDYCNETRNIDNMIEQFTKDKNEIIDLLENNPDELVDRLWSPTSPLCKDDDCLFNMGRSFRLSVEDLIEKRQKYTSDSLINYYVCPQCKNMRRLIDFSVTRRGEPFYIECGERAGSQMVYTRSDLKRVYLVKEDLPASVSKALGSSSINQLIKCSSNSCSLPTTLSTLRSYHKMQYLGSDSYTNNVLINWYLSRELAKEKIPNLVNLFIGFICNGEGYNLYEYLELKNVNRFQEVPNLLCNSGKPSPTAKADDKSPLKIDVVRGIILQLFALLHTLRKYDFSHGNPCEKVLRFTQKPVSYLHDGVHVVSPITLKLTDFSKSGCTVLGKNKIRLYSKSIIAETELKKRELKPFIDTVSYVPYGSDTREKVTIYKIKDPHKCIKSSLLFMYLQHLGLPIYQASFDSYAFMIVLMSDRSFYSTVMNDKELYNLFRNMWITECDFETVKSRLIERHDSNDTLCSKDVLRILSNLGLRCDMIDFGFNLMKTW